MKEFSILRKTAAALVFAVMEMPLVFAQRVNLPVIADDPSVVISTLPCGMKMYYYPCTFSPEIISMALVQIPDSTLSLGQLEEFAARSFEKASFHRLPFGKFLASNGILPRRDGYFTVSDDIVYHLDSISLARGDNLVDSVLFGVFRIAGECALDGIPASSQALVVAGDIKYDVLSRKVEMMSMLCPQVKGENVARKYVWKEPRKGDWKISVEEGRVSRLVALWRDARIPQPYMKTVLPAISAKMSNEFGWLLRGRLYSEFRLRGIHVWIDYKFSGSADTRSDEISRLVVYCAKADTDQVRRIMETEIDRLYTWGVSEEEYKWCTDAFRYAVQKKAATQSQDINRAINMCVSHFLCGASLATAQDMMRFQYRQMPHGVETRLFNDYLRKRLCVGARADSTLEASSLPVSRDSVLRVLSRFVPCVAVKMSKDRDEYFSGGRMWRAPTGPVFIHKKTESGEPVHFCYAVKGGGQFADMDYLSCVDGVPASTLKLFLSSYGVEMNVRITPECVYFSGSVPVENLQTVLKTLCAISNQKENREVFSADRYKLLVTVGPVDYEEIKKTMALYASALGPGADVAVSVDAPEAAPPAGSFYDSAASRVARSVFPLNMSSNNYVLLRLAYTVFRDRLAAALSGTGVTARISCGFEEYPQEKCRLEVRLSREGFSPVVKDVLKTLSEVPLDKKEMDKYVRLVRNGFTAYKSTPQYYIDGVVRRYVDFKDLYTDFESNLKITLAADLNAFFAAAHQNMF